MASSPSFREAYKRRRCIIPATSFTEWTGPAGHKTRHSISRADGQPLFFAGLWERAIEELGRPDSYTMLMIDAREDFMGRFHNRQPVILDEARANIWLDLAADPAPVLAPPPAGTLVADPPKPAAA
jgi:putative SOS response-associated peptidase YedK